MKPFTTAVISNDNREKNASTPTNSSNMGHQLAPATSVPDEMPNQVLKQPHRAPTDDTNSSKDNIEFENTLAKNNFSKKTADKFPVRLVLILPVVLGLSLIIYLYIPSNSTSSSDVQMLNDDVSIVANPERQLETIANQLIESKNQWDSVKINEFITLWNTLAKPIRRDLADAAWYKHFVFIIETKFKKFSKRDSINDQTSGGSNDPLLTLAFTLDIVRSNQYFKGRRLQKDKFKKLLANVQSEISKVDTHRQSTFNKDNSDSTLNDALRQEFEISEKSTITLAQKRPAAVTQSLIDTPPNSSITITGDKIRTLISEYKNAFMSGDLAHMRSLFHASDSPDNSTLVNDLLDSYNSVFSSSVSRSVSFENLVWKYAADTATGTGQYKTDINLTNEIDTQSITATIVITLQILDNQLKISNILLKDKNIVSSNPDSGSTTEPVIEEMPFLATTEVSVPPTVPTQPSNRELADVVNRFVAAYESGNIDRLVGVLSNDIKTNDKFSLNEIKKDYMDLFKKSSSRKMLIEDMRWKFQKNHAKGTGNLSATITSKNLNDKGTSENIVKGKIQIIAKRIDGNILITHLYHIERNQ